MRNDLKAAVDELEALKTHYDIQGPGAEEGTECHLICSSIDTALDALRDALKRQPDPITGLMPCGCGEKAMLIGLQGYSYECIHCGTSTRNYEKEEHAKTAWNTAMGWKGGAV